MRLVGMLDSPYVRRTAISLDCLRVPFQHEAVSVISTYDAFQRINPVLKAPTLVCDDGTVLMDSSLILQFIEASAAQGRSLWPATREGLQRDVRVVGLALAACEKAVQGLYERQLRPADKQHAPWLHRVTKQLNAALQELEREWANASPASPPLPADCAFSQASITSAVAWQFIHSVQAEAACAATHPALAALSAALEASDVFKRHPPVGPGVQASAA